MKKITYHKEGDYLIPDLCVKESKDKYYHIGKYSNLRLNYLKKSKRSLYMKLLINGCLRQHLQNIDKNTNYKVQLLVERIAKSENVNEKLKEHNQLEWVQSMNNIKNRAEEIVFNEIIYV